jgi:hypothetical protein
MAIKIFKFTGKLNRRQNRDEGDYEQPLIRENLLSRDGHLKSPQGTETFIIGLTGIVTWSARYHTLETGIISPKTFCYTQDGKLWAVDDLSATASVIKENLNSNAYPNSWLFKTTNQVTMYFVDGLNLYSYDGNNDNRFDQVTFEDADGNPLKPIDLIEHRDRNCVITKTSLKISKNLDPAVFDDATDSIEIIIGSGKGENFAIRKINEYLYILNTEGIYVLYGDTISALAGTFEIRLVEERKICAFRSACKVERSIIFLAAFDKNIELWSFDGTSCKMLSYLEKLTDYIHPAPEMLIKACSTYYNNYYMVSVVETGKTYNNIEFWYDTLEDKVEIVRGRNVSCYMQTDPSIEQCYQLLGRSDTTKIMWADRGRNFDGVGIARRLLSRDITPSPGENVRFTAFYPKIEPTGKRSVLIRYLLDGRLSDTSGKANFGQDLSGESIGLGFINISNQGQFTDRLRPLINYSRGTSIAINVEDASKDLEFQMTGFGLEWIGKGKKKGKKVGQ